MFNWTNLSLQHFASKPVLSQPQNQVHMKKIMICLFIGVFTGMTAWGQNQPPQVQITNLVADTLSRTLTISFNLSDPDNDPLEVFVGLSADSGQTHLVGGLSITGDVGFPVMPGTGKSVTIVYDADSLIAAIGSAQAWSTVRITATDRKSPSVDEILAQLDSASVMADMQFLAQPRHHLGNPAVLAAIKDSLHDIFVRSGLTIQRLPFQIGAIAAENIKGRRAGISHENRVVIIDGHFDAVPNTPGADDNASAVAAVLAAARAMEGFHFRKTVDYIGFDLEEIGLRGAMHYVANHLNPRETIEGVINGEMIGYLNNTPNSQQVPAGFNMLFPDVVDSLTANNNRGIFLFSIGNTQNSSALNHYFDSVARVYVPGIRLLALNAPGLGALTPDLRRSDHAVFWDAGIPALMITDGADTRNPHYHQPSDAISTLDPEFLFTNIKAMVAVVSALAQPIYAGSATSQAVQLALNLPLSTAQIQQFLQFELYPNPSDGRVYLRFDERVHDALITVHSAGGKPILQTRVSAAARAPVQIGHLGQHAPGLYFLTIEVDGVKFHRRLILHEGHQH
jgi:hypothetical protein